MTSPLIYVLVQQFALLRELAYDYTQGSPTPNANLNPIHRLMTLVKSRNMKGSNLQQFNLLMKILTKNRRISVCGFLATLGLPVLFTSNADKTTYVVT